MYLGPETLMPRASALAANWQGVVSVRDIAATILDLAAPGSDHALGGATLASVWSDAPPDPDAGVALAEVSGRDWFLPPSPLSIGDIKTVIDGTWQYIAGPGDVWELYDMDEDPWEQVDQAGNPFSRPRLAAMRALLTDLEDGAP